MSTVDYRSEAWTTRKRAYRRNRPARCHRCNTGRLELHVHHCHYRYPLGQEPDCILIWLCVKCHRKLHRIHDKRYPRDQWPYKHLADVTVRYVRWGRGWFCWRAMFVWMPDLPPWTPPPWSER